MHVLALPRRDCLRDLSLYSAMLTLRGRAFPHWEGPDPAFAGEVDIDRFDAAEPTYFLAVDQDRTLVGSLRALPTLGPTLIGDGHPELAGAAELPTGPDVVEISRLCVDGERAPEVGPHGVRCVTSALLAGLVEWGLTQRVTRAVSLLDPAMERVLRRAGWPPERVAEPDGAERVVQLAVDLSTLAEIREAGGLDGPVLAA